MNLNCQIFEFWAKPMEAQSAVVRYYSSSRSAEAANLCCTSHLIVRQRAETLQNASGGGRKINFSTPTLKI